MAASAAGQPRARQKQALRIRVLQDHQLLFWAAFRAQTNLRFAAAACAVLSVAIGLTGLVGWETREHGSFEIGFLPSAPATALTLILLGVGVVMLTRGTRLAFSIAITTAAFTLLLCTLRLVELGLKLDFNVSRLFHPDDPAMPHMGMGVPSVVGLVLAALAILLSRARGLDRPLFPLSTIIIIIGGAFLLGYVYQHPLQDAPVMPPMTLPTSIALLSLGFGLLMVAIAREVALSNLIDDQLEGRRRDLEAVTRWLDSVIDYAASGIAFFGPAGTTQRLNPAAADMLGYSPEMLHRHAPLPLETLNIVDEEGNDVTLEQTAIYRALQGETVLGMVVNLRPVSKPHRWISASAVPIRDDTGALTGAVAVLTDITALHDARARAQRAADELQSILDNAPSGIIFYDRYDNIIRLNLAARNILGYTDEIIALPPADRFAIHEVVDEAGEPMGPGHGVVEVVLSGATIINQTANFRNTPHGSVWLAVSAGPTRNHRGDVDGVVAVFGDVTALHNAQEQVRLAGQHSEQQRAELETVLAAIADGVMVVNADGILERTNRAAADIMRGYVEGRLGQHVLSHVEDVVVITGEDGQPVTADQLPVSQALRGEIIRNCVLKLAWPDGVTRWLSVSAAPVIAPDESITRVVLVYRDITALREHQQELERLVSLRTAALQQNQARLRALGADLANAEQRERQRLAAAIHDEVAQTLGAIKMHLEILSRAYPDASEDLSRVTSMVSDANTQVRAVMTELSPPVLQRIGLVEALQWWAGEVTRLHGLDVRVTQEGSFPRPQLYLETTLFQSTKELIHNSVKHARAREVNVHVRCLGDRLEITVADDGVGFDATVVETGGDGFGLFSIRERLAYLGGEFRLESAPNQGTRATLSIPLECH